MNRIVSISLGSNKRDKTTEASFADQKFLIERRGTNGNLQQAIDLIKELDPQVNAFGLGGIDLYLWANDRKYTVRDALKLKNAAHHAFVADGSGLKHTLERKVIQDLQNVDLPIPINQAKVLMVSGVDRWGMAETLYSTAKQVVLGDLAFAVGIPIKINTLATLGILGRLLLPIISKVPFNLIYPTGDQQKAPKPKCKSWFDWADIVAGDFHYIKRYAPALMQNKTVITNTTTEEDREWLKETGVTTLITSTPVINGRSFGANVLEACILTLINKPLEALTNDDYASIIIQLNLGANITKLQ